MRNLPRCYRYGPVLLALAIAFSGGAKVIAQDTVSQADTPPYTVVKRIPELEMYRCDDCHEGPSDYNATKRKLTEEHDTITGYHPKGKNDDPLYWCQFCHYPENYNRLRLTSGEKVTFDEPYRVCLQCHGTVKDEWEDNIHGKNKGSWRLPYTIYACTHCHDAHDPEFKPMRPLPAPHTRHPVEDKNE